MFSTLIRRAPLLVFASLCLAAQTPPRVSAPAGAPGARSCLIAVPELAEQPDPSWSLLDQAIPPCHRVIVTLQPGTRLRLDHPLVGRTHPTGVIELKTTVLGGRGIYDLSDQPRNLRRGVTMWVSLNLCEMRATRLLDDNDRPVSRLRDATTLVLGSEVDALAHSDELPDAPHFCRY